MEIHIHIHHHPDAETLNLLRRIDKRTAEMSLSDQEILAKVEELTTVQASMAALLDEIAQLVRDESDNTELANRIDALIAAGKEAVIRNTDVDPTPDPQP